MSQDLEITPVTGALGGRVRGADLRSLDEATFERLHEALLEHQVLFFPGSGLDDEAQMALAHRFGQPAVFPVFRVLGVEEPTFQVIEDGPESKNEADYWHTDVTWTAEPPKIALLRAGIVPRSGGDTMWASMTAAWEALSSPMQSMLAGLEVVHDNEFFIEAMLNKMQHSPEGLDLAAKLREHYPPVTHPLVATHPETGRQALLWGGRFMKSIVGMHAAESRAVLEFLERHIDQARFQCRWSWTPGDLAIWDERSTVHQAVNDHFPQERSVHRCVVDGERPVFRSAAA